MKLVFGRGVTAGENFVWFAELESGGAEGKFDGSDFLGDEIVKSLEFFGGRCGVRGERFGFGAGLGSREIITFEARGEFDREPEPVFGAGDVNVGRWF